MTPVRQSSPWTAPVVLRGSALGGWDLDLLLLVAALLLLGLVGVYSASISYAAETLGEHSRFLLRQGLFVMLGLGAALVVAMTPMRLWRSVAPLAVLVSLLLLGLVLLPGIGAKINGSTRWIRVAGINLQPSEPAKLLFLVYFAAYLGQLPEAAQQSLRHLFQPLGFLGLLCLLLLAEPDYGTVAVLSATVAGMMWLGGVRMRYFFLLVSLFLALLIPLSIFWSYRLARLTSFLDPWADPFRSGFQLTQALIAFGRGGLFGVGLGGSVQKLFYLPEAHTDFLLAVLAEELGLLAVLAVIALFTGLVVEGFAIARRAMRQNNRFCGNLAYGIATLLGLQAFVNIGVNMGALPTKGLTLPFMSYGGSSVVMSCIAAALLLRIDHENRGLR